MCMLRWTERNPGGQTIAEWPSFHDGSIIRYSSHPYESPMQTNGSATVKITKPITATRGCGKEIAIRVIRCKPATGGRFTEVFSVVDAGAGGMCVI